VYFCCTLFVLFFSYVNKARRYSAKVTARVSKAKAKNLDFKAQTKTLGLSKANWPRLWASKPKMLA